MTALLAWTAAPAQALELRHAPVECVLAGSFPEISASFVPDLDVAVAKVYFRAAATPYWYAVTMETRGSIRSGRLPRPMRSAGTVEYYINAVDREAHSVQTAPFQATVVAEASECVGRLAAFVTEATGALEAPAAAPPFPPGFQTAAAVAARVAPATRKSDGGPGNEPGAETATAPARSRQASTGGFPTTLLIAGVAAGGAVGAAVAKGRSGDASADEGGNSPPPLSGGGDAQPTPTPLQGGIGLQGTWAVRVDGTREVGGVTCSSILDVVFEIRELGGGALDGSATTQSSQSEPSGCDMAAPPGQTSTLRGAADGPTIKIQTDAAAGQPAFVYDGSLDGNRMSGRVSQAAFEGNGPFEGAWVADRR